MTETTPAQTTPGRDLRERIAEALTSEHYRRARERIVASPEEHSAGMADAVLTVVQPELDQRDAEIGELQEAAAIAHGIATERRSAAREATHRAEQAEAERDQLKATLARVRELAVMGGQEPVTVRQWIVIEIDQAREPT